MTPNAGANGKAPKKPGKAKGSPYVANALRPGETFAPVSETYKDGKLIETVDGRDLETERARVIAAIDDKTWGLLAPTDWMVIRQVEIPSKQVPADVAEWRGDVRKMAAHLSAEVEAAATLAAIDAVDLGSLWTIEQDTI